MGSSRVFSPYQLVHLIKLLANKEDGLLICDGVGVGKTISAGYILSYHQLIRKGDAAVVCPPVLTQKWRIELRDKFNLPTVLVASPDALSSVDEETQANAERSKPRIYVIPYSLLSRLSLDHPSALSLIVFDEIHAIRNPETQTYASALVLAQGAKQRIGLTATPIHNKLDDLASELSVLFPRYALEVLKVAISEIWATKKTELLHPWTTRFVKDKLSIHFTKRVIENRFVRYPENYTRRVEDVLDGTVHAQGRQRMSSQFDLIARSRLAASSPTAFFHSVGRPNPFPSPDVKALELLAILKESPEARWLVFCDFVETARSLASLITTRPVFLITGETDSTERDALASGFREREGSVLILTSVGSEGLDFQVASHMVNYDLHWNPMVLEQRIGRIDRIGQKSSDIHIYNLIVDGSIDERVMRVIGRKLALVTGTFADPGPVICSGHNRSSFVEGARLPVSDEKVIEKELDSANHFIKSEQMFRELSGQDYEFASSLPSDVCNIDTWPVDRKAWEGGANWLPQLPEVVQWSSRFSGSVGRLEGFLGRYR